MEAASTELYNQASDQYVGRWNRLISTTNWEKGRIILEWREDLIAQDAPASEYSDEAWSRRVGYVSPQHVGRLRRVSEQFDSTRDQYEGLFWSHFQAVLDWDDAEMWLEGSLQNDWSVSQMRNQRWEALGAPEDLKPRDEDIHTAQFDEDVDPALDSTDSTGADPDTIEATVGAVQDTQGSDESEESTAGAQDRVASETEAAALAETPAFRPFQDLPNLPDDLADALESFKLAILRHKVAGWTEVACDDVLMSLDALKGLALAPSED